MTKRTLLELTRNWQLTATNVRNGHVLDVMEVSDAQPANWSPVNAHIFKQSMGLGIGRETTQRMPVELVVKATERGRIQTMVGRGHPERNGRHHPEDRHRTKSRQRAHTVRRGENAALPMLIREPMVIILKWVRTIVIAGQISGIRNMNLTSRCE